MSTTTSPAQRLLLGVGGMVIVLIAAILIATRIPADSVGRDDAPTITVGDLTAARVRIRVNGVRSAAVTPLHPGDLITLHARITNAGKASLWTRTALDFAGTDPELAEHLYVYDGVVPTGMALTAAIDLTDPITFPGYVGTAADTGLANQPFVLDGTEQAETAGIGEYPLAVAIYLDPSTPQELLGRALTLVATVESAGYRDNADGPDEGDWTDGPSVSLG
ncbi:MAG: hypothetical protein QM572_09615 [Nocardioides sp.]|uniref:hypothetical protein n=1 Tax=Nocardioides sp. TaxID=35761 RepID=UPI0039E2B38E